MMKKKMDAVLLLRAVPYSIRAVLYYGISATIIVVAATITITTKHIWSFHNGVVDAFFVGKASCGCGGRWSIPSSNWIIDDEEAIGFIEFVVIIIIIIFIVV